MRKDYFIYMHNDTCFLFATREDNVPPHKIAARVSLTEDQARYLIGLTWREYQEMLEHYFNHGQKLVTA